MRTKTVTLIRKRSASDRLAAMPLLLDVRLVSDGTRPCRSVETGNAVPAEAFPQIHGIGGPLPDGTA